MQIDAILTIVGYVILGSIVCAIIGSYFVNVYKLIQRLNNRVVSFMTLFRLIGIFFPILGVILGVVKEEKSFD
jgi:H+/Cl- antiporter ClcA